MEQLVRKLDPFRDFLEIAATLPFKTLEFCQTDIHSAQHIVPNDLRSLSELLGASAIWHWRIFGAGHFGFLSEILSYDF
jgi:hypothetical protein